MAVDKQTLGAAIAICGTGGGGGGGDITVDSALSKYSRNPVQNKVIAEEISTIKSNMMNIQIVDGKLIINTGGD